MRKTIALLLVLGLAASSIIFLPIKAESQTIVVPDDYLTIEAAIGNATAGDTVLVKSGTYSQQTLEINKSLTIISQYKGSTTIMLHPLKVPETLFSTTFMTYANPVNIQSNVVKLSGFIIIADGGTLVAKGDQIQLIDNRIETWGVTMFGNGNRISGNKMATANLIGSNQTIIDNELSDLYVTGSYNLIARNHGRGMQLTGDRNLIDQNYFSITPGSDGGSLSGVHLLTGDHNTLTGNTAIGQGTGIFVGYPGQGGSYNVFAGNRVEHTLWGVSMHNGSYNLFYGNLIANNKIRDHDGYGLAIGGNHLVVESNLFFHNAFVNNSKNFRVNWDINGVNFFDNGAEGNYWDDYIMKYPNAKEIDNSGIGDTPYSVWASNNLIDNYPLINQPQTTKQIPVLPEPWQTLLSITILTDPALTYVQNSKQQPTLTPSPTESQSTLPSPSQTQHPTVNTGAEPPPIEPFPTAIVAAVTLVVVLAVAAGLLFYHKKHKRSLVKKPLQKTLYYANTP